MASTNIMTGYTYVANYIPEIVFLQVLLGLKCPVAWALTNPDVGTPLTQSHM